MEHRKEIDGLRAVAVLAVVFCHAGFPFFQGGFVGVDVFFVISGYLITSIILREMEEGGFSLRRFYERRARRILPALFLLLSFSLPAAWLWLWPEDFRDFARSVVYVALFASNIHFYKEIGYFEPDVELRPLLHTWSLGVEEQYYILFPLLILACWRFGRHYLLFVLSALALLSLALAQYGLSRFPEATFYLLPTRAWELLFGAIYAAHGLGRPMATRWAPEIHNVLAACGLLLILAAVFLFSPQTSFPGMAALVPVIGALLVIAFATPDTIAGKLLLQRPVLAIGLWSYSVYLWHQPVFAFIRYHDEEPSALLMGAMVVFVLVLSYGSWRFVEMPFRQSGVSGKRLLAFVAAGAVLFVGVGLLGKHRADFIKQHAPGYARQLDVEQALRTNFGLSQMCKESLAGTVCQTDPAPELLVWGDSFAMHLVDGFLADAPGLKLMQRTSSGCGPIHGLAPVFGGDRQDAQDCLEFNDAVLEEIQKTPSLRFVVLSSPFSQYLQEPRESAGEGEEHLVHTREGVTRADEILLRSYFLKTIERLRALGVEPFVVAPPPANGRDIGKCLARSVLLGSSLDRCSFSLNELSAERRRVYDWLAEFEDDFPVIWLHREICRDGVCRAHLDGTFLYRDSGHLSKPGSALLGKRLGWSSQVVGGKDSVR